MKTIIFDELPSTNDYAKTLDTEEDTVVIAKRQTKGKGTKGRSFVSDEGGVYISLLRIDPRGAKNAFSITAGAAVAVVKTLAAFGVTGGIKWPNDVIANGKKICGVLVENVVYADGGLRSVTGIGLNVNNEISEEIKDVAVSMKEITGKEQPLESVVATLVYNLTLPFDIEDYRKYEITTGKTVTVIKNEERYEARAVSVTDDGRLVLDSGETLVAAEVTIDSRRFN